MAAVMNFCIDKYYKLTQCPPWSSSRWLQVAVACVGPLLHLFLATLMQNMIRPYQHFANNYPVHNVANWSYLSYIFIMHNLNIFNHLDQEVGGETFYSKAANLSAFIKFCVLDLLFEMRQKYQHIISCATHSLGFIV